jgi:hypothetical protein
MKKNYGKIAALFGMLCTVSIPLDAQLSGLYTINSANSTSGTNYQTFTAFAAAITSQGVNGPVTVNVQSNSGPYNEQPVFGTITGASSVNKITINGNGNLVTFNSTNSNAPATLCFNGSDYVTVNNLNVFAGGSNYATAIQLCGGATNNNLVNCTFSTTPNTTQYYNMTVLVNGAPGLYYMTGTVTDNNTFKNSQIYSGYYGVMIYGWGTALNNQHTGVNFVDCRFEDFYQYGLYFQYGGRSLIKNNEFTQPLRTSLTGCYPMMIQYTNGGMIIDGNEIHRMWQTQTNSFNSLYAGIYFYDYVNPKPSGWTKHIIKNNIIYDIRGNGSHYGMFFYYTDADVFHNTISFDDPNSTSGNAYGFYHYGQSGIHTTNYRSNLISLTRGGSSSKYGFYLSNNQEALVENNDVYVTGSNSYIGYNQGTTYATHSAWKTAGFDANGYNINPNFMNLQTDLHPTNTSLNNLGVLNGVLYDQEKFIRHATTPDIGALEFLTPSCSGTPTMTVAGPNYSLCPGESATFTIGGLSSDLGYTYQWQVSDISQVGTWTVLAGENSIEHNSAPVNQTMWYSVVITCTAPGGGSMTAVAQVDVAGVTTHTAPYFEDFEMIGMANRLPNCSWTSPQLGSTARTYVSSAAGNLLPKSGTSFAAFNNGTPGTSYYYTNGIYMYPGITYSASVWYQTDLTGASNWSNLSIQLGTSQSPTGLNTIASTGGPAISPFYKPLSNTFTVNAPGYYYVAIKATSAAGAAQFLSWDDLRIEIPCSLNSPSVSLSANTTTICAGEPVVITASGADTYTWNTGDLTAAITVSPNFNTTYVVTGYNSMSGCGTTLTQAIMVNPSPVVIVIGSSPSVCSGKPLTLTAGGALTYAWSNGGFGSSINVSPSSNTTYQVIGTNAYNCSTQADITVSVNPLPNVTASSNNQLVCAGDPVVLIGGGATTYQWLTPNNFNMSGSPLTSFPSTSGTYTLTGTDANGCTNTAMVSLAVEACVGIGSIDAANGLNVYPNPTSGEFTVEMNSSSAKTVNVTDVTGRVILSANTEESTFNVNISQLAAGVYYVKVSSDNAVNVIKVVKQ